jgi:hypothetical protein
MLYWNGKLSPIKPRKEWACSDESMDAFGKIFPHTSTLNKSAFFYGIIK